MNQNKKFRRILTIMLSVFITVTNINPYYVGNVLYAAELDTELPASDTTVEDTTELSTETEASTEVLAEEPIVPVIETEFSTESSENNEPLYTEVPETETIPETEETTEQEEETEEETEEEETEEEIVERSLEQTVSGIFIQVQGLLPQDAYLDVQHTTVSDTVVEKIEADNEDVVEILHVFDISIRLADGTQYEPDDRINITFENVDTDGEYQALEVYHVEDNQEVTNVTQSDDGVNVTASTDSFSPFIIAGVESDIPEGFVELSNENGTAWWNATTKELWIVAIDGNEGRFHWEDPEMDGCPTIIDYPWKTDDIKSTCTTLQFNDVFTEEGYWPSSGTNGNSNAIPTEAFKDFTALTTIENGQAISFISGAAFKGCTSLTEINLSNCETILDSAFEDCTNLQSVIGWRPDERNNYAWARGIGARLFKNCSSLHTVGNTPNVVDISTVQNDIRIHAFEGCASITTLNMPSSIGVIGNSAFKGCSSLTSFSIDSVQEFGGEAFSGCSSLESFHVGTLTSGYPCIVGQQFFGCESLNNLDIPIDSILEIGYGAFYGCSSLTGDMVFPNVTYVEAEAFVRCGISSIDLPAAQVIEEYAFSECSSLETASLDSLTEIPEGLFRRCSNLGTISLASATGFTSAHGNPGQYAFQGCNNIVEITDDASKKGDTGVVYIPLISTIPQDGFGYNEKLTTLHSEAVTSVSPWAFNDCGNITTIYFPNATSYGEGAIYVNYGYNGEIASAASDKSSFRDIDLTSTTSIADYAFYNGFPAFNGDNYITINGGKNIDSLAGSAFTNANQSIDSRDTWPRIKLLGVQGAAFDDYDWESNHLNPVTVQVTIKFDDTHTIVYTVPYGGTLNDVWDLTGDDAAYSIKNYVGGIDKYECFFVEKEPEEGKCYDIDTVIKAGKNLEFSPNTEFYTYTYNGEEIQLSKRAWTKLSNDDGTAYYNYKSKKLVVTAMSSTNESPYPAYPWRNTNGSGVVTSTVNVDDVAQTLGADGTVVFKTGARTVEAKPDDAIVADVNDIILDDSVTTVGAYAFQNMQNNTALQACHLTSIGKYAFSKQYKLENIDLSNVAYIGDYAFWNSMFYMPSSYADATEVDVSNANTIGWNAFEYCTALKGNIQFKQGAKIYPGAFAGTGIESVGDINGCTLYYDNSTGHGVFYWAGDSFEHACTSLTTVGNITNTALGKETFKGCTNLASVGNLTNVSLGDRTFQGCVSLSTIGAIDANAIPAQCFENCELLGSVTLTDRCTAVNEAAFKNCYKLTTVNANKIATIGNEAFRSTRNLKDLPNMGNVVTIGESAFEGADLRNAALNAPKCTSIGGLAFRSTKLPRIEYLKDCNIGTDEKSAFGYNSYLVTIGTLENCTIHQYAFKECYNLQTIDVLGVNSIPKGAFDRCTHLSSLGDTTSVIRIEDAEDTDTSDNTFDAGTFYACDLLQTFSFPNCTYVGKYAFYNPPKTLVSDFYLPSVVEIGEHAFDHTTIGSINIDSAEIINDYAFDGARMYCNISLPSAKEIDDWAFYYLEPRGQISTIAITDTEHIEVIGEDAFRGSKLSRIGESGIDLPACKSIGNQALMNLNNISGIINLPSIETIGERAFLGDTGITGIILGNEDITIGTQAFQNIFVNTDYVDGEDKYYTFEGGSNVTTIANGGTLENPHSFGPGAFFNNGATKPSGQYTNRDAMVRMKLKGIQSDRLADYPFYDVRETPETKGDCINIVSCELFFDFNENGVADLTKEVDYNVSLADQPEERGVSLEELTSYARANYNLAANKEIIGFTEILPVERDFDMDAKIHGGKMLEPVIGDATNYFIVGIPTSVTVSNNNDHKAEGNFNITVRGNLDDSHVLKVEPSDDIQMTRQLHNESISLNLVDAQNPEQSPQTDFVQDDINLDEDTNIRCKLISDDGLQSGNYIGSFVYTIQLTTR